MLRFLLTFLSLAVLVAGEVAPAATPPAAQAVLERLAKAEAKIDFDAAKARSTERLKAIKELEKVQVSTTKSGDLDAAVAIKARIEELRKLDEIAADELMGDAKPAAKDPAKLAVGSWSATKTNGVNAQIEMKDDKSAKAVWGPLVIAGTWLVEKDRILIRWGGDSAKWENLGVDGPDKLSGDSHDAGKDGIIMVRVKK